MKTRTLTISILLLAIVLAPLAMAERNQRGPHSGREHGNFHKRPGGFSGHPGMGGFLLGRMADKLELTDEQRADIKAITEEAKPEAEEVRQAVREAMKALHEATADGTEAEIIAAGKAVGDTMTEQALLRAARMKQRAARMERIEEILTDEQFAQFEELKAEMKKRMQQRHKDGDGPHKRDGQRRWQKPDQD